MECPYCGIKFSLDGVSTDHSVPKFGSQNPFAVFVPDPGQKRFSITSHICPECGGQVMRLNEITVDDESGDQAISETTLLYPKVRRALLPTSVPDDHRAEMAGQLLTSTQGQ